MRRMLSVSDADQRFRHRMGTNAVARDAAGGVGRRAARGAATLFRDAIRHL